MVNTQFSDFWRSISYSVMNLYVSRMKRYMWAQLVNRFIEFILFKVYYVELKLPLLFLFTSKIIAIAWSDHHYCFRFCDY